MHFGNAVINVGNTTKVANFDVAFLVVENPCEDYDLSKHPYKIKLNYSIAILADGPCNQVCHDDICQ